MLEECKYKESLDCSLNDYPCSERPNCYFKQLERLREENQNLYKALNDIRYIATSISFSSPEGLSARVCADNILNIIKEVL